MIRVGMPLFLNILAACSYFLMVFAMRAEKNISDMLLLRNVLVTIK